MQIPHFVRSFLTFRIDWQKQPATTVSHEPPFSLNNARIQIESRCRIRDRDAGTSTDYVLGASCKTERVGVERDIWTEPNADFCIILSQTDFLILKSWDRNDKEVMRYPPSLGPQPERQIGDVAEAYDDVIIDLHRVEAERLETAEEIVSATLANDPLVGRVDFSADEFEVTIEFPIKTMNANERDMIYQTDTGPIIVPELSTEHDQVLETFRLAYVAFNQPAWAEFILQVPTPLTDAISVSHYSRSVRLDTQNSVYRLPK